MRKLIYQRNGNRLVPSTSWFLRLSLMSWKEDLCWLLMLHGTTPFRARGEWQSILFKLRWIKSTLLLQNWRKIFLKHQLAPVFSTLLMRNIGILLSKRPCRLSQAPAQH
uniref:Uncharacterized protein n=1 Tax=Opuntia streptacantha TaxID=393608 RepID=A0A7C9AT72_OPUST